MNNGLILASEKSAGASPVKSDRFKRGKSEQIVIATQKDLHYTLHVLPTTASLTVNQTVRDAESIKNMLRAILPPSTYVAVGKLILNEVTQAAWRSRSP